MDPFSNKIIHDDATNAIKEAFQKNMTTPQVVAWVPEGVTQKTGWIVSDPKNPVKETKPEILCSRNKSIPLLPLTEDGAEVLYSVLKQNK